MNQKGGMLLVVVQTPELGGCVRLEFFDLSIRSSLTSKMCVDVPPL